MQEMQDYTDKAVPEGKGARFGWFYLMNIENAVTICVPVFMFAAMLGMQMSGSALSLALCLGGLFLSILSGWSSYIGTKTRMSTALLVQSSFGTAGAKIVWGLLVLVLLGWFGVQTELFAKAFMHFAEMTLPQTAFNQTAVTIVSGLLMASTAVLGIRAVGKLAQLAIPLLLGVIIYAFYDVVSTSGIAAWLSHVPENPMPVGIVVAAIVGGYAVGVVVMPDIKRFAKDAKQSVFSAVLALGVVYPLLLLVTAVLCVSQGQSDFMILLVDSGIGAFALVILMLAAWTTNDLNLYSASLNISTLLPHTSRPVIAAVAGAVGTGLAVLGVFESMIPLFMLIGVVVTPLLAIYSFDFLSGQYFVKSVPTIRWLPLLVWGGASAVGIMTTPSSSLGLGVFAFTTVPALDSLLVALLLAGASFCVRKKLA